MNDIKVKSTSAFLTYVWKGWGITNLCLKLTFHWLSQKIDWPAFGSPRRLSWLATPPHLLLVDHLLEKDCPRSSSSFSSSAPPRRSSCWGPWSRRWWGWPASSPSSPPSPCSFRFRSLTSPPPYPRWQERRSWWGPPGQGECWGVRGSDRMPPRWKAPQSHLSLWQWEGSTWDGPIGRGGASTIFEGSQKWDRMPDKYKSEIKRDSTCRLGVGLGLTSHCCFKSLAELKTKQNRKNKRNWTQINSKVKDIYV